jgi:zinc finger protein
MGVLENQTCPFCFKKTLSLTEEEKDISGFGIVYLLSMGCSSCNFSKTDVELFESSKKKLTFDVESKKDFDIVIIKSSSAKIKIPTIRKSIKPSENSSGCITDVKGLIEEFENILISERDSCEDKKEKKSIKNTLKKLWKVKLGEIPLKIIIEDPSGNSVIVSDKVK